MIRSTVYWTISSVKLVQSVLGVLYRPTIASSDLLIASSDLSPDAFNSASAAVREAALWSFELELELGLIFELAPEWDLLLEE